MTYFKDVKQTYDKYRYDMKGITFEENHKDIGITMADHPFNYVIFYLFFL